MSQDEIPAMIISYREVVNGDNINTVLLDIYVPLNIMQLGRLKE